MSDCWPKVGVPGFSRQWVIPVIHRPAGVIHHPPCGGGVGPRVECALIKAFSAPVFSALAYNA